MFKPTLVKHLHFQRAWNCIMKKPSTLPFQPCFSIIRPHNLTAQHARVTITWACPRGSHPALITPLKTQYIHTFHYSLVEAATQGDALSPHTHHNPHNPRTRHTHRTPHNPHIRRTPRSHHTRQRLPSTPRHRRCPCSWTGCRSSTPRRPPGGVTRSGSFSPLASPSLPPSGGVDTAPTAVSHVTHSTYSSVTHVTCHIQHL